MGMYLAWSVYKLVLILAIVLLLYYFLNKNYKISWKYATPPMVLVMMFVLIMVFVFNIGERQQNLNRSKFNNNQTEVIEKVSVDVLDSSAASKQYKESFNKGE